MRKRSLLAALAVALLMGLIGGTPSEAASTLVTVNTTLTIPSTQYISEIDVTMAASAEPFTGLKLAYPPAALAGASITYTGNVVKVTPGALANSAFQILLQAGATFSFVTNMDISASQAAFSGSTTSVFQETTPSGSAAGTVTLSYASVPEPASLTMLGIGVAGFLAFRRFFRQPTTA
jgi:hypothetical protein